MSAAFLSPPRSRAGSASYTSAMPRFARPQASFTRMPTAPLKAGPWSVICHWPEFIKDGTSDYSYTKEWGLHRTPWLPRQTPTAENVSTQCFNSVAIPYNVR
jgi:hypothetical protein